MNWRYPLVGAVTFVALHRVLVVTWQTWFHGGGGHSPWFMNTVDSVLLAMAVFFVVNVLVCLLMPQPRVEETSLAACQVVAGAIVPMVVTLATLPEGPGNMAPVAIFIGIIIVVVPSVAGALVGFAVRKAILALHS